MSVIINITFLINPLNEEKILSWVRASMLPMLFNPESPARNCALRKVIEVGGEVPSPEHGLSIALQAEFENQEEVRKWNSTFLESALGDYHLNFGPESLFFVTLLENLPL